jgi:ribosomal protein S18 acetylase RimI-like enzyme
MTDDLVPLLRRMEATTAVANEVGREVVIVPPFQLSFHPTDALIYLNYAMPLTGLGGEITAEVMGRVREAFRARGRVLRFEFFEGLWPELGGLLEAQGVAFEERMPLMLCAPGDLRAPRQVEAEVVPISERSSDETLAAFVQVREAGFGRPERDLRPGELEEIRAEYRSDKYRTMAARVDGRLVAIASVTVANDELVGVATAPAYRRRGLAAALCHAVLREHFAHGGTLAWLSAADEAAERLYGRLGFRTAGSALSHAETAAGTAVTRAGRSTAAE